MHMPSIYFKRDSQNNIEYKEMPKPKVPKEKPKTKKSNIQSILEECKLLEKKHQNLFQKNTIRRGSREISVGTNDYYPPKNNISFSIPSQTSELEFANMPKNQLKRFHLGSKRLELSLNSSIESESLSLEASRNYPLKSTSSRDYYAENSSQSILDLINRRFKNLSESQEFKNYVPLSKQGKKKTKELKIVNKKDSTKRRSKSIFTVSNWHHNAT